MNNLPNKLKPMLAGKVEDPTLLTYPVLVSPKIDGIRCLIVDGVARSRSLRPIPNRFIQKWASEHTEDLDGLDGELVIGHPADKDAFNNTTGAVRRIEGEPDFSFWVFDRWDVGGDFAARIRLLHKVCNPRVFLVPQTPSLGPGDLAQAEAKATEAGFEGIMVRDPHGPYKFGRSTFREGYLLKVKRYEDLEARVVGFQELLHNANEAKMDALGHTERSSHAAGKVPMGTLGALKVKCPAYGEFDVGTGFTAAQRQEIWDNRASLQGSLVTVTYFRPGTIDKPRHPVFKGFRMEEDV